MRNNRWENTAGTAIIALANASDWRIYNNVFFTTNPTYTTTDCAICVVSGHGYVTGNMKVYSNTFVNLQPVSDIHFDLGTGNEASNNLFYGPNGFSLGGAALAHDHNWCLDTNEAAGCASVGGEPSGVVGSEDPFVDSAAHDYRLKQPLPGGKALGPPYDTDLLGNPRTEWDFGAYEFVPADTGIPAAPQKLKVR